MTHQWLLENNVEFFHNGNELIFLEHGTAKPFSEISLSMAEMLLEDLENHPEACKSLDTLGIHDPVERIMKFAECRYGAFNETSDFTDKSHDVEIYNCGNRGNCIHEGKLCNNIVAKYGIITRCEIRIIQLVAAELTDKEIADRLFNSPYTVNTHITNILGKIGCKNRVGIAMFAVRNNLI
ncbi:MAG: response regulator transcription factor [Bacteroidales bacterium]